jgi:AcrR family transcriptional regulator
MVRNNSSRRAVRNARRRQEPPAKAGQLGRTPSRPRKAEVTGLRERKKARLRQQIIDTSIRLFRERGYENTRIDDIVEILEISQPTFFRYFPTKDAVLHDFGLCGFARAKERLEEELSKNASTAERLHEKYQVLTKEVESDRPLWRAVVLSGVMDPVRSPDVRRAGEAANKLLQDLLLEGQKRGEITRAFPADQLTEHLHALCNNVIRRWAVGLLRPDSLTERVRSAVDFFLRAVQP